MRTNVQAKALLTSNDEQLGYQASCHGSLGDASGYRSDAVSRLPDELKNKASGILEAMQLERDTTKAMLQEQMRAPGTHCGACHALGLQVPLQKCARCGYSWYCSKRCMQNGWRQCHNVLCGGPHDLVTGDPISLHGSAESWAVVVRDTGKPRERWMVYQYGPPPGHSAVPRLQPIEADSAGLAIAVPRLVTQAKASDLRREVMMVRMQALAGVYSSSTKQADRARPQCIGAVNEIRVGAHIASFSWWLSGHHDHDFVGSRRQDA